MPDKLTEGKPKSWQNYYTHITQNNLKRKLKATTINTTQMYIYIYLSLSLSIYIYIYVYIYI
jgi:hypothetical protein